MGGYILVQINTSFPIYPESLFSPSFDGGKKNHTILDLKKDFLGDFMSFGCSSVWHLPRLHLGKEERSQRQRLRLIPCNTFLP